MPDFFPPNRELTIEEIVKLTGAEPRPDTPLDRRIRDIAPLDRARSTDITFLDNPKYLDGLATTRAGICLTAPRFAAQAPDKLAVLVAPEPYRAFVMVARPKSETCRFENRTPSRARSHNRGSPHRRCGAPRVSSSTR